MVKVKKALTSLDVAVITNEIRGTLLSSRVVNIYGVKSVTGNEAYVLKIRKVNGEYSYLYIEPGCRINLTKYITDLICTGKISLLRRFLRNSKITEIKQHDFERIVEISTASSEGSRKLIIELIPRGVLCITDNDGRILFISKSLSTRDRELRIGLKYVTPPKFPNVLSESITELTNRLLSNDTLKNTTLGSALVRAMGIAPEIVNEVLGTELRSKKLSNLDIDEVSRALKELVEFMKKVIKSPRPSIVINSEGNYVSFHPFEPKKTLCKDCRVVLYNSFNEVVDEYYREITSKEVIYEEVKKQKDEVTRLSKVLENMEEEEGKVSKELEKLNRVLNVLSNNYLVIDKVLNCCVRVIKNVGWDKDLLIKCGISSFSKDKGVITLNIEGTEINLKINAPLNQQYFELIKRIKILEKKLAKIKEKKEEIERELKEIINEVKVREVEEALLLRIDWFSKYHWIITTNGFIAIGGRNAEQNERVVRRYLRDKDIFVHADIHGGSAFVILCNNKEPDILDLMEVATLAACYSKAWKAGLGAIDVYWVKGYQVSKAAPAGEYLSVGAFAIKGKKNYIRGVKLELALGIEVINNRYMRIFCGPEELVSKRCVGYVVLVPGNDGKEVVAKEIVEFFKSNDRRLLKLNVNNVLERIPGKSRIVKKVWKHKF